MAKVQIVDAEVTVPLSELEPGDVFQMGRDFYVLGFVSKPLQSDGTIRNNFYNATQEGDSCSIGKYFLMTNFQTGEIVLENIDKNVSRANAKLLVNRVRNEEE